VDPAPSSLMTPGDRSGWLAAGEQKLSAVPWPVTTRTRCAGCWILLHLSWSG